MNVSGEVIFIPVSFGELVDKVTILRIKAERVTDHAKLLNIRHELDLLEAVVAENWPLDGEAFNRLIEELHAVNGCLWTIEDDIRDCERACRFDERFVELARSVYRQNDRRAELKRKITLLVGSDIVEEKSYAAY